MRASNKKEHSREWAVIWILCSLIIVNTVLAVSKLYIGLANRSLPIIIDSTNNFFDVLSAFIVVIGFIIIIASKRNKKKFSKIGRAEYTVNFISNIILVGLGVYFMYQSSVLIARREKTSQYSNIYVGALAATIVVKLLMGIFAIFFKKKYNSQALGIVALDSFTDTGTTLLVTISYVLRATKIKIVLDGHFGIILSLIIIGFAIKVLYETWGEIIGTEIDKKTPEVVKALKTVLPNNQCGDLILHDYGVNHKFGNVKVCVKKSELLEMYNKKKEYESEIKKLCGLDIQLEYISTAELLKGKIHKNISKRICIKIATGKELRNWAYKKPSKEEENEADKQTILG